MKKILVVFLMFALITALPCTVLATNSTYAVKPLSVTSGVEPMPSPPGTPAGRGPPAKEEEVPPDLSQPNKWAVIIGIADYRGVLNDLWNPDDDARDMWTVLTSNYGFAADHIKLLIDKEAKAKAILSAISWVRDYENDTSTVVFFFAGHGYQAPDDWDDDIEWDGIDECIVSWDMYGITDGRLALEFSTFESTKIALIFGQCFSGGMNDISADGSVIVASSLETQYSYDINPDWVEWGHKNTLFGYFFVDEGMLQGLADADSDGVATVEETFTYAYTEVIAWVDWYNTTYGDDIDQDPCMFDCYPTTTDNAGDLYL